MATKKGSKSSKTAHVLNVLSGVKADAAQEEEGQPLVPEEVREPAPAKQEHATVQEVPPVVRPPLRAPILEMARANDEALSDQIHHLLEKSWEEESGEAPLSAINEEEDTTLSGEEKREPGSAPASEPAPAPTPTLEPTPAPTPTLEPTPAPTPTLEPTPVPEPTLEPTPVPEPAPQISSLLDQYPLTKGSSEEHEFCHVNVMQALVDEKCMRYIKMFGLCDCSRCVADVKALALTNLQSKYLVMHKGEVIPMLTVYEGRYNTTLTAQLIQACKIVMDNPRHDK